MLWSFFEIHILDNVPFSRQTTFPSTLGGLPDLYFHCNDLKLSVLFCKPIFTWSYGARLHPPFLLLEKNPLKIEGAWSGSANVHQLRQKCELSIKLVVHMFSITWVPALHLDTHAHPLLSQVHQCKCMHKTYWSLTHIEHARIFSLQYFF